MSRVGGDLAFERGGVAADGFEARKRSGRAADGGPRLVDRIEKRGQREQPQRLERPPFDRQRVERLRQLGRRAQRERSVRREEARRFGRMGEQIRDRLRLDRGLQPAETLAAHRRQREGCNSLDDPIEFEGPQGAWLHR